MRGSVQGIYISIVEITLGVDDHGLTFNTADMEDMSKPKRPPPIHANVPTMYYHMNIRIPPKYEHL